MADYKDELKYQKEYAKSQTTKNERAGTMTKKKRAAYGKTIRTADQHLGTGAGAGKAGKTDAAKNFIQALSEMTLLGKEQRNLDSIKDKTEK